MLSGDQIQQVDECTGLLTKEPRAATLFSESKKELCHGVDASTQVPFSRDDPYW